MEVKINREIRNYTESIFFGLSLRQFLFSLCGCVVAVIIYFLLKDIIGLETTSWVCMLGASPFVLMGFVRYNNMTMEELFLAWIRSEFLIPKYLKFVGNNYYYEVISCYLKEKEMEELSK